MVAAPAVVVVMLLDRERGARGRRTGDSVTVAPALTLADREYQRMRDIAIAIMREVGVDAGRCDVQFAVEPSTGRVVVIEMNPRVSRSSALRVQGHGLPRSPVRPSFSLGYTLDEIPNDITRKTRRASSPRWTTWWSRSHARVGGSRRRTPR
ncbi:hypothetical protein QJS66_03920 [Kocuria rhizophila]|nr:hypothetical protein QJS66_03920 [Kocuria rhizophila]